MKKISLTRSEEIYYLKRFVISDVLTRNLSVFVKIANWTKTNFIVYFRWCVSLHNQGIFFEPFCFLSSKQSKLKLQYSLHFPFVPSVNLHVNSKRRKKNSVQTRNLSPFTKWLNLTWLIHIETQSLPRVVGPYTLSNLCQCLKNSLPLY